MRWIICVTSAAARTKANAIDADSNLGASNHLVRNVHGCVPGGDLIELDPIFVLCSPSWLNFN